MTKSLHPLGHELRVKSKSRYICVPQCVPNVECIHKVSFKKVPTNVFFLLFDLLAQITGAGPKMILLLHLRASGDHNHEVW